ncbi:DUF2780 domain-containing protein [Candidatus Methylobacter oryzae]|uniref:DUF2780 domain-containing protein n=1 Tax=Candidatus Methylobacter oryzae TaxID=2497749 RepID=A0ABY3CB00_9GAMM|nr:DUF2780 domain-containing protein [Candidatus Methylobacter oryzae]TRW94356.1 DUF2780 domain-containing protein [Candidatus Methylobacter oryzae]
MQQKTILTLCASLAISATLINDADAANWKEVLNAVNSSVNGQPNNTGQALLQQGQQTVNKAQPLQAGSLTDLLMQRTGVTQAQAMGGAGALFQIAKTKMQADAFAQLERSVPGMQGMLGAAPVLSQPTGGLAGRLSSIAGASGGTVGNLISAASAFEQQGMSPAMIQQFVPVVIDYVRAQGNDALVNTLSTALIGR